jgi:hypothetical protein
MMRYRPIKPIKFASNAPPAYRSASKAGASQGERVFLQGKGSGLTIQMWVNKVQRIIEAAWPKF